MATVQLIESLRKGLDQPTQLFETHISWVILSGEFAYKIKKPINFGFIDYTDLNARKGYCELEVALNQRLAKSLYVGVIPITGTEDHPEFEGTGQPIEYAVKMYAFSQDQLFSHLIKHQDLTIEHIETLSKQCAEFHQAAAISQDPDFGTPEAVIAPMRDNFDVTASLPAGQPYLDDLKKIQTWVESQYEQHHDLLAARKKMGFIRAAHGDLHLGNIVLYHQVPVVFDCIEFNESFRWTDVMGDIGFLAMDLEEKGRPDLAARFVNKYFELTNDYEGAQLLTFYASYRAMVRAKVAAIQLEQVTPDSKMYHDLQATLKGCIELALEYTTPPAPILMLTHGVAGTGKTTYTHRLLTNTHTIRLSADVIRKHLFQLPPFEPCPPSMTDTVYSEAAHEKVYGTLCKMAENLLLANKTVIIDATFVKKAHRAHFIALAKRLQIKTTVISFELSPDTLQKRLATRQTQVSASDADRAVAAQQLAQIEPVSVEEGVTIERIAE